MALQQFLIISSSVEHIKKKKNNSIERLKASNYHFHKQTKQKQKQNTWWQHSFLLSLSLSLALFFLKKMSMKCNRTWIVFQFTWDLWLMSFIVKYFELIENYHSLNWLVLRLWITTESLHSVCFLISGFLVSVFVSLRYFCTSFWILCIWKLNSTL